MTAPMTDSSGLLTALERINYRYGLLLDETRLRQEQHSTRRRSTLINQLLMGSGVVCGLGVTLDETEAEDAGLVAIDRGCALDPSGNMILVPESVQVDPHQLTDDEGNPLGDPLTEGVVEICLAYAEQLVDPVPLLIPDCTTPGASAPATIREGYRVLVRQAADEPPPPAECSLGEFPLPAAEALHSLLCEHISTSCPEPAPAVCIPLARVMLPVDDAASIDLCASRPLVYSNALLYELILCLAERVNQLEQA
jgi:hypothetical protein